LLSTPYIAEIHQSAIDELFCFLHFAQIHTAIQQPGFLRVKRGFRAIKPALQHSLFSGETSPKVAPHGSTPTDPYFSLQWYLRNTGQNGGKVRLDLNVQAAWDQGITGKNVTTAIMDDGKFRKCMVMLIGISLNFKLCLQKF
jgi:hypothetical protein